MEIDLDLSKSLDENASAYFEKAKESRKKILGLKKALSIAQTKSAEQEEKDKQKAIEKSVAKEKKKLSKKWFMHFRWFFTSDNLLVIGGRDAKNNEEVVKNRMKKNDVYFHAEVFGAPHCVICAPESLKEKEFVAPESSMSEAAQFAVTFSKAWEEVRPIADAYSVKPAQVSKSAKSGEFLGTGAFMIYGERNWFKKTPLTCAIGFFNREQTLMCGPLSAIKKHCTFFVELKQGSTSKELSAKVLRERFIKKGYSFSVDDFVSLLPNGSFGLA
ncbi:MAG: NFACT RNA binding domain-containing protein [archaeon]